MNLISYSWEQRKFGDVVNLSRGLTYSPENISSSGIRVLRSSNINEDYFEKHGNDVFVDSSCVKINTAHDGDILITSANGSSKLVGKHAVLSGIFDEKVVHGGFMLLAKTNMPYFLNSSMSSNWYKKFIDLFVAGGNGAIGNLNKTDLENYEFYIPSKTEQEKIGQLFFKLDSLITLHQRKLIFLKSHRFLMSVLFCYSWEQRKLGELGKTFIGLSGKTSDDFGHGDAKFLPYLNIFNNPIADINFLESTEIDKTQNEIKYGDVFFTTSSETPEEVGMSSVWLGNCENIYLNSFCFGFRPLIDFNPYYFGYLLRSDTFRNPVTILAQGISRFNISKNKVMEIEIPLPAKREQEKIGQLFYKLDTLITLHQRKRL